MLYNVRNSGVVKVGYTVHMLLGEAEALFGTVCKALMPYFEVEYIFLHFSKDFIGWESCGQQPVNQKLL